MGSWGFSVSWVREDLRTRRSKSSLEVEPRKGFSKRDHGLTQGRTSRYLEGSNSEMGT